MSPAPTNISGPGGGPGVGVGTIGPGIVGLPGPPPLGSVGLLQEAQAAHTINAATRVASCGPKTRPARTSEPCDRRQLNPAPREGRDRLVEQRREHGSDVLV